VCIGFANGFGHAARKKSDNFPGRRENAMDDSQVIDSAQLLEQFNAGQSSAARAIFDRYVARLIALVGARLAPGMRRRVDPEDVVQSAFRSFFVHAVERDFVLARSGDLWRLLAAISLHKVRDQVDRQRAARRDYRRELDTSPYSDLVGDAFEPQDNQPSAPDELAALEHLRIVFNQLPDAVRDALTLRLAGHTIPDIAIATNRSERTVRRLLDSARHQLTRELMFREPTR
jgi:DNA-directed RNA polymerase specialized sigma24 family protein